MSIVLPSLRSKGMCYASIFVTCSCLLVLPSSSFAQNPKKVFNIRELYSWIFFILNNGRILLLMPQTVRQVIQKLIFLSQVYLIKFHLILQYKLKSAVNFLHNLTRQDILEFLEICLLRNMLIKR